MFRKTFTIFCLVNLAFAVPANKDDRITFQDDDIGGFENRIFKSDNKDNFRLDLSERVQKELENGGFYQGDIILHEDQRDLLMSHKNFDENDHIPTRTGLINEQYRWPKNALGFAVMPYVIDSDSGYCKFSQLSTCAVFYIPVDIQLKVSIDLLLIICNSATRRKSH